MWVVLIRRLEKNYDTFNSEIAKQQRLNVIIRKKQTHKELAQYLHAACISPKPSTFIKAIKNDHFTLWLGLTTELVTRHLPKSITTTLGHITSEKKGLQLTKNKIKSIREQEPQSNDDDDFFPPSETPNTRHATRGRRRKGEGHRKTRNW